MADVTLANTTAALSGDTLVTAEDAVTITGLHTFDRDPNAPFAVTALSAVVPNLDADKLDGQEGAYYRDVGNANAGTLAVARGGTGLTAGTSGGVLGYTATGTLASSAALTANALVVGAGAGATPTALASLGTTTTLLHGNAAGAPTFSAVALASDVSGTLPVANGGTGLTAGTSGGVLGYTATGTLASSAALTANALVLGGGAGATPTAMGSLGTTTTVLHGNAAGAPTFGAVDLATDITGNFDAATTLDRNAIGTTSTDGYVLNNSTAAAAGLQQISPRLRLTGQGWKTDATAASQTVDWIASVVPVQGAANPQARLDFNYQINGAGYQATPTISVLNGTVGIGTTTPTSGYKLDVAGNLKLSSGVITVGDDNATRTAGSIFLNSSGALSAIGGSASINFNNAANTATNMTILNAGDVGIGTATPGAQLDLSTDSARKLTTTTWATGSDIRIKTDVETIRDALDVIRKMRPVKYRYSAEFLAKHPDVKDTDYYNFIAQEYQQVFPNSVTTTDGQLYLNPSNMIPYAIAGIKEIDARISQLEQRLLALERTEP